MSPDTDSLIEYIRYTKNFWPIKQPIFSEVEVIYEFWKYWLYKRVFTDWFSYNFIWRNYWEIKMDIFRFNAKDN